MAPEELFELGYKGNWAEITMKKALKSPVSVARQKGLDVEDLLQYALTGLWIGCLSYDKSKGTSFKTHAINQIRWHLLERVKRECNPMKLESNTKYNWNKMRVIDYLDAPTEGLETYADNHEITPSKVNVEEQAISNVTVSEILEHATKDQIDVLRLRMQGYTYREIGEMYGKTGYNMNAKVLRLKKKLIKEGEVEQYA